MFFEKEIKNKEFKTLNEIKEFIFEEVDNFSDCPNYIINLSNENYKLISKEIEESTLVFKTIEQKVENGVCTIDYSKDIALCIMGIIIILRKNEN
jgi:mRNA-degrading endonuclease HigB of HigAB toxin-antitoxin module